MRVCFSVNSLLNPVPSQSAHFGDSGVFWVWDERVRDGMACPALPSTCRGPCRCHLPDGSGMAFDAVICQAIGHRALLALRKQGIAVFQSKTADIQESLQLWRDGALPGIERSACLAARRGRAGSGQSSIHHDTKRRNQ
ncbi:NifB/NifX family molybdenum-iron cluster-binding protein [Formivibrio citricus]|uniref:NifB/NifX family molybdenum-iron cluster-binding protein n=1 Tax=Formivibrio citricus TaxID=83765 RepID=UPI000B8A3808|nr:NifB/NifX family molybdenum-iron cluster-binding protein [Formivibrio citricus]